MSIKSLFASQQLHSNRDCFMPSQRQENQPGRLSAPTLVGLFLAPGCWRAPTPSAPQRPQHVHAVSHQTTLSCHGDAHRPSLLVPSGLGLLLPLHAGRRDGTAVRLGMPRPGPRQAPRPSRKQSAGPPDAQNALLLPAPGN